MKGMNPPLNPEAATKVGGKGVLKPLKSGESCQLLENAEPGLHPAWRAPHANRGGGRRARAKVF